MAYRRRYRRRRKKNSTFVQILLIIILFLICYYNKYGWSLSAAFETESESTVVETYATPIEGVVEVYYLDVGEADSILIRDGEVNALIDAGNNADGKYIVKFFKDLGINDFKYVFGKHAHEDHIGGMDDIINNFNVSNFYMPDVITTTATFEDVLDSMLQKNMALQIPKIGEKLTLKNSVLEVLYSGTDENDLNNTSMIIRLDYGNNSFLFTGDATSQVERAVLNSNIDVNVLKVSHHGSKYSTTLGFLNKVSPEYAVISVGKNTSYGHPHEATLNKLTSKGIKIYRTDEMGTIIAATDGQNITFKTVQTNTNGG